jgi:peroxiredoxin
MNLTLGSEAPAFDLPGVDGEQHSLDAYADAPALAVIWSCNHCPYVQAWEGRMIEIQRDYADRGVKVVAVSSNDAERYPEDSFDEMTARAERLGFNFDYLYDQDQSAAKAYRPERTPEVFLFDRDRKLVYHGAIDDSREEDLVQRHHLREALDAVLEGTAPAVAETPAVGCTVKWKGD